MWICVASALPFSSPYESPLLQRKGKTTIFNNWKKRKYKNRTKHLQSCNWGNEEPWNVLTSLVCTVKHWFLCLNDKVQPTSVRWNGWVSLSDDFEVGLVIWSTCNYNISGIKTIKSDFLQPFIHINMMYILCGGLSTDIFWWPLIHLFIEDLYKKDNSAFMNTNDLNFCEKLKQNKNCGLCTTGVLFLDMTTFTMHHCSSWRENVNRLKEKKKTQKQ